MIEDGRIEIEGISGTSAGAINAVMVADGLARGGPQEACKRLADFWRAASLDGGLPALQRAVIDRLFSFLPMEGSPVQSWFDALSRFWSPYDLNPLNINPLKDVIERFVDFDAVRTFPGPPLFVSATNVHTGRLRVFPRDKITADVVMASACLPMLFRAVEIDGVPYWDGGYLGNPAIFPFFDATETEDVLLVQINPIERRMTPRSQNEIVNRINEITFNSSLMAEFRAIDFVVRLIDQGRLPRGTGPGEYRRINVHRIALDSVFDKLTAELQAQFRLRLLREAARRRQARRAHVPAASISTTSGSAARSTCGREPRRAGVSLISARVTHPKPPRAGPAVYSCMIGSNPEECGHAATTTTSAAAPEPGLTRRATHRHRRRARRGSARDAATCRAADLPQRGEFVVRSAHVLTMDAALGDLARGDVHVRDGAIVAVGTDLPAPDAPAIDGRGMIALPGLIDTHNHLWNATCRNIVMEGPRAGLFPDRARARQAIYARGHLSRRAARLRRAHLFGRHHASTTGRTTSAAPRMPTPTCAR